MDMLLPAIGLYTTALLLGTMAFFSGVIAPLVFVKLDAKTAGGFIRQVFPWYYLIIIVLAGAGALALMVVSERGAHLLSIVCALAIISRQLLMPRINAARDAVLAGNPARETMFNRLHRASVWINGANILLVAVVLFGFVSPLVQ